MVSPRLTLRPLRLRIISEFCLRDFLYFILALHTVQPVHRASWIIHCPSLVCAPGLLAPSHTLRWTLAAVAVCTDINIILTFMVVDLCSVQPGIKTSCYLTHTLVFVHSSYFFLLCMFDQHGLKNLKNIKY